MFSRTLDEGMISMLELYTNIKKRRTELGMTQEELAKKLGYSDKSMISRIESGKIDLPQTKIIAFAGALNTTPMKLMGWVGSQAGVFTIPVLGRVAAGIPIEAVEDVIDYEELSSDIFKDSPKNYFGLQVKGNSMEPRICNGDYVIVHKQEDAETDDTVIAMVNGNDAVCKRLKKYADSIALVSLNPAYEPMLFTREQIDSLPVRIIGKVVELRGKL